MNVRGHLGDVMMSYCPRCGEKVPEGADYCPSCGSDLGRKGLIRQGRTSEKAEKHEKEEKSEKEEKHEKEEFSPLASFVGGICLVLIGVVVFLNSLKIISLREAWPYALIVLGVAVIVAAAYAATTARKRSPRP